MAVLDVIEDEQLQQRALDTGDHLVRGLRELQRRHELIGDVRGEGMYLGVDLVADRATREPAGVAAAEVVERLRVRGVLVSTDGPDDNVLKLKPPIVFGRSEADVVLAELDEVLSELARAQPVT
jgi:4-aminobutyrate aminotransferase-like enzyme